jgi:hypothetical protein
MRKWDFNYMSAIAKKKINSVERTAKQWAWMFLRRNPNYRDAFSAMSSLNPDQKRFLHALIYGQIFESDMYLGVLETFPTRIFDPKYLKGLKKKHHTLFDYLKDIGAYNPEFVREWGGISEHLQLFLLEKFRLESYAVKQWIDPERTELSDEDELNFGYLNPTIEHALIRLEINQTQTTQNLGFPECTPPKEFLTVGRNGILFFNARLAKKWQAALQKVSGDGHLAKADPTQSDSNTLADATFDLSLPIKAQIDAVKKKLDEHQKALQDAGVIEKLPSRKDRDGIFSTYIKILDLQADGMNDFEITAELKSLSDESYLDAQGKTQKSYSDPRAKDRSTAEEHAVGVRKQIQRARHLRDHGYRSLALQSD